MLRRLLIIGFGTFLIASLHAGAQDGPSQEQITKEVRKRLIRLSGYSAFDWFGFEVQGSTVRLTGFASRPGLAKDAAKVTQRVKGVEKVQNDIEVLPNNNADRSIRTRVYAAVYGHTSLQRYLPGGGITSSQASLALSDARRLGPENSQQFRGAHPIHFIVKNGHVTLLGVVGNNQERIIAETQARQVPGVFSVTNELVTR